MIDQIADKHLSAILGDEKALEAASSVLKLAYQRLKIGGWRLSNQSIDGAHAAHLAQEPAEANGITKAAGLQLRRGLLHPLQRVCGENPDPACCSAITKMEAGEAEQVRHRGGQAPAGVLAARMPPWSRNGQGSVLAAVVSDSESPGHDVIARRSCA